MNELTLEQCGTLLGLLMIAEREKGRDALWLYNTYFGYGCPTCGGIRELMDALKRRLYQDAQNKAWEALDKLHAPEAPGS